MAYTGIGGLDNGKSQAGSVGIALPPRETPLSKLWTAIDRLRKADADAERVTSILCGPTPGACDGAEEASQGLFDEIERAARIVAEMAASISEAASRIERRL